MRDDEFSGLADGETNPQTDDDDWAPHALFPDMTREQAEQLVSIGIERETTDGVYDRAPQRFSPDDITDTAVVVHRFGGGRYRFCACNSKKRIYMWYPKGGRIRCRWTS